MGWAKVLIAIVLLVLFFLFATWLFLPYNIEDLQFIGPSNFSINGQSIESSQFYPNMRFPYSNISYNINNDCSLQKKNDMERAFDIIEEKTILSFYSVADKPEISVYCTERVKKTNDNTFVAGEGGPTSATTGLHFTVIFEGEILLIRDVECNFPNVAVHELLHVLGFNHSANQNNIMYPVTSCGQEIGEDTIQLINQLYSAPSYPDIVFVNASARVHGRYLDLNVTIKNDGLVTSEAFPIRVFADGNEIKNIDIEPIEVGYGRKISIRNIGFNSISVNEFLLFADTSFSEFDRENNKIILDLKN